MIELPIGPANTPAPSHVVDWTERFALVVAAIGLRATRPEYQPLVAEGRLDALHRIEMGIAESLMRGGTPAESAAFLAFSYIDRCVGIASSAVRA